MRVAPTEVRLGPAFISRLERFASVPSTNDVVRAWLEDGTPEVCLAVADEQTAGRGRSGRTWTAPPGAALLLSLGFRPTWLTAERAWQLAAIASLAMADAAEEAAGLPDRSIRLKWPNDLVVETVARRAVTAQTAGADGPREIRKLAGVLGETVGLGGDDPRVVVGLGINAGWPEEAFPADLAATMTSLSAAAPGTGRAIDRDGLLDVFLGDLEARIGDLRAGQFDAADWTDRQLTTGRMVRLDAGAGSARTEIVRALGVDPRTGALVVADPDEAGGERSVMSGEIHHLRVEV